MKRFLLFVVTGLIAIGGRFSKAQTVEDLVRRHLEALGGREALDGVRDVRQTGTATFPGGSMEMLVEWKRPSKFRIELRGGEGRIVRGFNGQSAWETTGRGEFVSELRMKPETVTTLRRSAEDFLGSLTNLKNKTVRLEGTETVGTRKAIRLLISYRDGPSITSFLDAETLLPIREDTVIRLKGVDYPSTTEFTEYRRVGGIQFALRVRSRPRTATAGIEMTIRDIWPNLGIPDDHFERP